MEGKIDFVISMIKQKRELSSIDSSFVMDLLNDYIEKNKPLWNSILSHPKIEKCRELKILVKDIRKKLREIHGVFNIDLNKRNKLLAELELSIKSNAPSDEIIELHKKILLTHKSTRERLNYYKSIYNEIFSITGIPKVILDIGSGLNPISTIFTKLKNIRYIAIEFTEEDCSFLNKYFKMMHINGIAVRKDLLKHNIFPKSDVCFLFKVLDSIESIERNSSKNLLDSIDSKFIVISFPKKTLSGKDLSTKRLAWFRKIAKTYYEFEIENEVFYIIKIIKKNA